MNTSHISIIKTKNINFLNIILPLAGIYIYALSGGIRGNLGLLLNIISKHSKISYSSISFIIAFTLIFFGIVQPLFGILTIKKSNFFVLFLGTSLLSIGLFLLLFSKSFSSLFISLGIFISLGTAALSFGIVLSSISSLLGEEKTNFLSGIITASSGIGSLILTPTLQNLFDLGGFFPVISFLIILTLFLFPIIFYISKLKPTKKYITNNNTNNFNIFPILKDRSFIILFFSFILCGFHLGIVEIHYYSQIISYNINTNIAAYIFLSYGLSTTISSIILGFLCSNIKIKYLLSFLYFFRALTVILFFIFPKTSLFLYIFSILLGISGASVVSPTSSITNYIYGPKKLATLFGIIFLGNQIGSFISAWLGGILYTSTNSYNIVWFLSIFSSIIACIISFFIKEEKYIYY